jgi:hypothetical protein
MRSNRSHFFWELEHSKSRLQTSWTLQEAARTPKKTELQTWRLYQDLFIVNLATQFLAAWMSQFCSESLLMFCPFPRWHSATMVGFYTWRFFAQWSDWTLWFLQRCARESQSGAWLCWMENCEAGHGLCLRLSQLSAGCIYHIFASV